MGDKVNKDKPVPSQSTNVLSTPLTVDDFQYLSREMKGEWEDVARNLKITEGEIYKLRSDYGRREREVIYQMLLLWKQREASKATRDILAEALRKEKATELAEFVLTGKKPS